MILILRGRPGVGKTTVCERIAKVLTVDGFITKEIRMEGKRVGFEIHLLKTGDVIPLARRSSRKRMVGRYEVFVENLDRVVELLESAEKIEETIIIDELGKMESMSNKFVDWVLKVPKRWKKVVLTAPSKDIPILVEFLNVWKDSKMMWLNENNRMDVLRKVIEILRG